MRKSLLLLIAAMMLPASCTKGEKNRGFLEDPPVFIDSEPDVPLTLMSTDVPKPGDIIPGYDSIIQSSTEFRRNGTNVQPGLNAKFVTSRIGAIAGITQDWGGGISIPWQQTRIRGTTGGLPATRDVTLIGDLSILGKKRLWRGADDSAFTVTAGLEFPTGDSTARFDQSNAATNGYYHGFPQRMPLSWEPGGGTVNGYLAAAYGARRGRFSYVSMLATKLHTSNDENVKIGDIFIAAASGTYGIAKPVAVSLSLVLRNQADDSYPQAPAPGGVNGPLLQGTTNHGVTLYVTPSIRFSIANRVVIGAGLRYPAITPDDGFVPDTRGYLIIYPQ